MGSDIIEDITDGIFCVYGCKLAIAGLEILSKEGAPLLYQLGGIFGVAAGSLLAYFSIAEGFTGRGFNHTFRRIYRRKQED